jgi:hypothetical protein
LQKAHGRAVSTTFGGGNSHGGGMFDRKQNLKQHRKERSIIAYSVLP